MNWGRKTIPKLAQTIEQCFEIQNYRSFENFTTFSAIWHTEAYLLSHWYCAIFCTICVWIEILPCHYTVFVVHSLAGEIKYYIFIGNSLSTTIPVSDLPENVVSLHLVLILRYRWNLSSNQLLCLNWRAEHQVGFQSMAVQDFSQWVVAYHHISNVRRILVVNEIFDHADVVGAAPVAAAATTSPFST